MAELFQFGAQFQVIVDFAVEDDYSVAIQREDRLIAAFEVNNFQAGGAKRADFGLEDSLLVRARWTRVAAARRMRSESGDQFLWVKPAMPHKFQHSSVFGFHQW